MEDFSSDEEYYHHPIAEIVGTFEPDLESGYADSDEDGGGGSEQVAATFDMALPMQHTYLGNELEQTQGFTFFDEGSVISLPILPDLGIVLFPGQLLPLTVLNPLFRESLIKDKTIGIPCIRNSIYNVGTTAEVVEYICDWSGIRIKARGRQRFKILSQQRQPNGGVLGKVKILPELTLPTAVPDAQTPSFNRFRKNSNFYKTMRLQDMAAFPWPKWLIDDNDLSQLVIKVTQRLKMLKIVKPGDYVPDDGGQLAYWASRTLPLEDIYRVKLLALGSTLERLQYILVLLRQSQNITCIYCFNLVGYRRNVYSTSLDGANGLYCNPGGYVHDIVTLTEITGNCSDDREAQPSTEYTWFPGYAWTITLCGVCKTHLGWKFTAVEEGTLPRYFWGLRKNSITMHHNPA